MNQTLLSIDNLWTAAGLGVLCFFVVILVEAVILKIFKLNSFGRCLRDSLMANIGSALLNTLLFLVFNKVEFEGMTHLVEFGILFLISALFEAWIIKLLNKSTPWSKILAASFVMNLVSFAAAYYAVDTYMF